MKALAIRIAAEAEAELRSILAWWAAHAIDPLGGFHGAIGVDDAPVSGAEKGIILNTRILWFFSEAAIYLHDANARALANRAADYVKTHFVDPRHGGVWWSLDARGAPLNRRKQTYAQAFAIYALIAHFKASGDPRSLDLARALFALVERHCAEHEFGGYLEARGEDWGPIADVRLSEKDANAPKSMNTHLHLLEAYSALHAAAPTPETAVALRNLIDLHINKIAGPDHLKLFFGLDWRDQSESVSFGHDIEASWLIWEAQEALRDAREPDAVRRSCLALARSCLREGLSAEGGIIAERMHDGRIEPRRVWWVQAEAMAGFLNAFEMTREAAFFDGFARVWEFIKRHHITASGEWSWWSSRDRGDADRAYKSGFWKGPYHNGRAMIETSRRLKRLIETGEIA